MFEFGVNSMQKHELLVPAGNMECLRQAVTNGCDAVYLACKSFGARKFAQNFTNEEIVEAIKYCHLYGVRIYVTMNTLVKNSEVDQFLEQVCFLHKNGVDALIVQDFGMICLLRKKFPNLEIHASTQANISSRDICKLYYDLGVKRVVFSRELSIDEIDSIDVPIEKEAFIHGALCISYSGCCLMSSMLGGRSGNRGECAGCCRLPYTLKEDNKVLVDNKYILSTKELNTSIEIDRLLSSSIYSFKIEGRMKGPLYVGFITRLYRRLIDGEEIDLKSELDKLKTIFNREFTTGRMFKETDQNFMNIKSPNHVGLKIGKVVDVNNKKIKIELDKGYTLNQYDVIRFLNRGFIVNYLYDSKDKLINSSNNICYVDNKVDLKENDIITKTQDYLLEKEFMSLPSRKVNVSFKVNAKLENKLFIEINDGINKISVEGNVIEKALTSSVSEDNIIKQLSKLNDTPFRCNDFDINMDDNIFISLKELNELRRELVSKLIELRENKKIEFIENEFTFEKSSGNGSESLKHTCTVYNEEQLLRCVSLFDRIYVYDIDLYNKYKNKYNIYYIIPRCSFNIKNDLVENSMVSDYTYYSNVVGNYTLNVTNIYTAYFLNKIGVNSICLSVELSELEINEFIKLYNEKIGSLDFEVLVYGRVENMIIKGNILNLKDNYYKYYIEDSRNRSFPVYYDGNKTHILNYENVSLNLNELSNCTFRYDFYNESIEKIESIVKFSNN